MNDSPRLEYRDLVEKVCKKNGVKPIEVLCGVLSMLGKHYKLDLAAGEEGLPLSENLKDLATWAVLANKHNAVGRRSAGQNKEAEQMESQAAQAQAFVEILEAVMPSWTSGEHMGRQEIEDFRKSHPPQEA